MRAVFSLTGVLLAGVLGSAGLARALPAAPARCEGVEITGLAPEGAPARVVMSPAHKPLRLAPEPIARFGDLSRADVNITEGQPALNITLNPEAARRVRAYSAAHVGEGMAILVNGKPAQVFHIRDPITGDGILIAGFSRRYSERLAAEVNAHQPVCP